MKIILSLLFLFVTACGPKFKVGDCIQSTTEEKWEHTFVGLEKIIELGINNYHMIYLNSNREVPIEFCEFSYIDHTRKKVECPK